jgi:hypothetical protein
MACRFNDADVDQLTLMILGGTQATNGGDVAIGFGGTIELLDLPTFCGIPVFQSADQEGANNGIWFPRAFIEGLQGVLMNRMQANSSSNNQYSANIRSARATEDQDAQPIPNDAGYGWMGPPNAYAFTTPWTTGTLVT